MFASVDISLANLGSVAMPKFRYLILLLGLAGISGCGRQAASSPAHRSPDPDPLSVPSTHPRHTQTVEDFDQPLVQLETVFWDPDDTVSLRKLIRDTPLVKHKRILEIGTGTGLVSLCCLKHGARDVVATDVNPWAVANAALNAERLKLGERLETRRVPLDNTAAFAVIGADERFDLIITNPPWEDAHPTGIEDYALYDENFVLIKSLLGGLKAHLTPGGKALLAYGNVTAIRTIQKLGPQYHLTVTVLDDRSLDTLDENFLPGMLLEVVPLWEDASSSAR